MTTSIAGASFLITGGASLIGSHITDLLLSEGAQEVRLFDNLSLGTPDTVRHLVHDARVKIIKGDVLRLNELIDATKGVNGIFALAGYLTLPMSQNPALGVAVNSAGVVNTCEAARIVGARKIVFSSSTAVYGSAIGKEIVEETPIGRAGVPSAAALYGTSKLLGEAICAQYAHMYGLECMALRFSSVYGERQHWRAVNSIFIAETYERIRRGERPVIVGDGSEVHDYIYVTDVADACVAAMDSTFKSDVLNIVTGVDTNLNYIVERLLIECGASDLRPEYREDRRPVRTASLTHLGFSRAKAEREIGWVPKTSIDSGVRKYIAWRESIVKEMPSKDQQRAGHGDPSATSLKEA
jgi:UDP-glucose 4-epimerase